MTPFVTVAVMNHCAGGDNTELVTGGGVSDLRLLPSREVMERDAKDYADSIHAVFVETSAKNAININELFIEISEYLCLLGFLCAEQLKTLPLPGREFSPGRGQAQSPMLFSADRDLRVSDSSFRVQS